MFGDVPLHIVDDEASLARLAALLEVSPVIAVDTESNSMYAHTERVCLIQFSVFGSDWIVDPLAVRDLSSLAGPLADPSKPKIFHGADYDIRCLHRDYGFRIRGLFDTLIAAQMLAMDKVGLADLLIRFFGVEVDKQFQRYDWGLRPLHDEHLEYARGDTHFLAALRELLIPRLERAGRLHHLEEECRIMEEFEFEERVFEPNDALELRGSQVLDDVGKRVLRRLFVFREEYAKRTNRPTYKVIPNDKLIELARVRPRDDEALGRLFSSRSSLRSKHGKRILEEIEAGRDESWAIPRSKPKKSAPSRGGPSARLHGRAADRVMEALKAWRNELCDSDPAYTSHNVVSNTTLKRIAAVRRGTWTSCAPSRKFAIGRSKPSGPASCQSSTR
jgi:ribonuclease D